MTNNKCEKCDKYSGGATLCRACEKKAVQAPKPKPGVKALLAVLAALSASPAAHAAYGDMYPKNCYPGQALMYQVVANLGHGYYEIHGLNVAPQYVMAVFKSKIKIDHPGSLLGGGLEMIGTKEVPMRNGFTRTVPVWTGCKQ